VATTDSRSLLWVEEMKISEIEVKGILTKSRIPGVDYSLNPYVGCFFGCRYCYASFMRRFTNHQEPWGEFVGVKINTPEVLHRQLQRAKPGQIVMSLVTDPYQPIEKKYQLTRRCLEVFLELRPRSEEFSLSILTRSALVLRDIDLLKQPKNLEVGMSVTTDNDAIRKLFEPWAHSIPSRIEALRRLKAAGIKTYAFIGPMLPMNPDRLANSLVGVVDHVLMDRMNYTQLLQLRG
jgi:DNA repair photolyase